MSNSICERAAARKSELPPGSAAAKIIEGLDLLAEERHPFVGAVEAFRELLVERVRFREDLDDFDVGFSIQSPDPLRFQCGVPLSTIDNLLDIVDDARWITGAERLTPVMARSFPSIKDACEVIGNGLCQKRVDPRAVLAASPAAGEREALAVASRLGVKYEVLAFMLGQIAKPLLEKLSCNLSPLVERLHWDKGYCPICGTMPELALLKENGARWLGCPSCSHEWKFALEKCPYCGSEDREDLEVYFLAGREHECVDVCHKCKRYVLTVDMRKLRKPMAREVAAMAVTHLDALARDKGFLPASVDLWNVVGRREYL